MKTKIKKAEATSIIIKVAIWIILLIALSFGLRALINSLVNA